MRRDPPAKGRGSSETPQALSTLVFELLIFAQRFVAKPLQHRGWRDYGHTELCQRPEKVMFMGVLEVVS